MQPEEMDQLHEIGELEQFVKEEVYLRKDELGAESIRTPALYDRFLKLYYPELNELRRMQRGMKLLLKNKTEYYLGKADPEVYKKKPFDLKVKPIKSDLNLYLDADEDLQHAQTFIDRQDTKVDYLKNILSEIRDRGYRINAAIESDKFNFGIK